MNFKQYIAKQLVGKRLHFKCDCIIPLDHSGVVVDYVIENNEIIFKVNVDNKIVSIGENHPNLIVTEV